MFAFTRLGPAIFLGALAANLVHAQVDPPEIPPTPDWNRGITAIEVGDDAVYARIAFESGPTGREERDLGVDVVIFVNRKEVASQRVPIVIQPGIDKGCSSPPCFQEIECGTAVIGPQPQPLYCRESTACASQPFSCDCRCGETRTTVWLVEQQLAWGDEITVILRPLPNALEDLFTSDDRKSITVAGRLPNGNFDGNMMLDLDDFRSFNGCVYGPAGPRLPTSCKPADIDRNGFVDMLDLQKFQLTFSAFIIPCSTSSVKFHWPLPGVDARHWVINNYLDLAPGSGLLDWMGNAGSNAKTYNGHKGIDIDVPTFRAMDNDFPVVAAAGGFVVDWFDDSFDRNTSCSSDNWNFVEIEHLNGFHVFYGHLKRNSVVVDVGDWVVPGQKLGVVGSSGCSTAPHLHYEVHDCDGNPIEPFSFGMWHDPPVYNTALGFMDASLRDGSISNANQIKDPPPNVTLLSPNDTLGLGLSLGGGGSSDDVDITIRRPNNSVFSTWNVALNAGSRHTFWWNNFTLSSTVGFWKVEVETNGSLTKTYSVGVSTVSPNFFQQVRNAVPASSYQTEFNDITAAGYRPVWVDGYDVLGNTYFNAIFDRTDPGPWAAAHDMTGSEYDNFVNDLDAADYRLVNVDSYLDGGAVRYAAIMVKDNGPTWVARHGQSASEFQDSFDTFNAQGYRPVNISVVRVGGQRYYTSLYDKKPVGVWVALPVLSSSQYQTEFENNTNAGRTLAYLNGYNDAGTPRFSAIWNSTQYDDWEARHDRSLSEFQNDFDKFSEQSFLMSVLTGYQSGLSHNFGAFWYKD